MEERVYNFSAGPGMIYEQVLEQTQEDVVNFRQSGMGVPELSHRGSDYLEIQNQAEVDLRDLMGIPDEYAVLFLQGGATAQFAAVPLNLRGEDKFVSENVSSADYIVNGEWGKKAQKEAAKFLVDANIAAQADTFTYVPSPDTWKLRGDKDSYVHITTNETINGVELFDQVPVLDVPIVADMSSHILSRPINVEQFDVIYAGAQKNIGPAGLTVVIANRRWFGLSRRGTPSVLDWEVQANNDSALNTPPTLAVYMAGQVFKHLKRLGGLETVGQLNDHKAQVLYDAIDGSDFYANPVQPEFRSKMNVPFTLADAALEGAFKQQAKKHGLLNLGGHRSVGGLRASLYNAMPDEGVHALADFMIDFERREGKPN
jgi:phosphoserine aminotransferase